MASPPFVTISPPFVTVQAAGNQNPGTFRLLSLCPCRAAVKGTQIQIDHTFRLGSPNPKSVINSYFRSCWFKSFSELVHSFNILPLWVNFGLVAASWDDSLVSPTRYMCHPPEQHIKLEAVGLSVGTLHSRTCLEEARETRYLRRRRGRGDFW